MEEFVLYLFFVAGKLVIELPCIGLALHKLCQRHLVIFHDRLAVKTQFACNLHTIEAF